MRQIDCRRIRSELNALKIHLAGLEDYLRQANEIIYRVEEMTFDYEDGKIEAVGAASEYESLKWILEGYNQNHGNTYNNKLHYLQHQN